jgi:hypothetical protein
MFHVPCFLHTPVIYLIFCYSSIHIRYLSSFCTCTLSHAIKSCVWTHRCQNIHLSYPRVALMTFRQIPAFWSKQQNRHCHYFRNFKQKFLSCFPKWCFYIRFVTPHSRSQYPSGLRQVLSRTAWTLGSQVRILLGAWMCVRVFLYCVVLCR